MDDCDVLIYSEQAKDKQKSTLLWSQCNIQYIAIERYGNLYLSNADSNISVWFWRYKVKVAQSCLTLYNPMDYTVHGILQARIQEWVAVPFSRGSSQPRDRTLISCIEGQFFTSWAGFFTSWATMEAQEYWSGYLIPFPGIFPTQESNWGLLHCRRILYQLRYQGRNKMPSQNALTIKNFIITSW